MAHLILIKNGKSFVDTPHGIYGTLEEMSRNMDKRRYPLNGGYIIPTESHWQIVDVRIKYEVIGDLAKDVQGMNLNPINNNMTLWKVLSSKVENQNEVHRLFKLIQWFFKWANRKKRTSLILFVVSTLTLQFWVYIFIVIILLNPLKPIPISDKDCEPFSEQWKYVFLLGTLHDPAELQDDALNTTQEDIL